MEARGSQQQPAATSALWLLAICSCFVMGPARADESVELAKKLANPVANLISVPIKLDWDTGIGSNNADQYNFVIQPVIPFSLNSDWSLISRTIAPFIEAKAPQPGLSDESGLGDITQSFFFSPKAPTAGGWILGAGPSQWPAREFRDRHALLCRATRGRPRLGTALHGDAAVPEVM